MEMVVDWFEAPSLNVCVEELRKIQVKPESG